MIFDSSSPTGGDFDLGSPHQAFGGPGIGKFGKVGPFKNTQAHGNVLTISEDGNSTEPDDSGGTLEFQFDPPVGIESVGLLDNEEGATFEIQTSSGSNSTLTAATGGNGSFMRLNISTPSVAKLIVDLKGSTAITDIQIECTS